MSFQNLLWLCLLASSTSPALPPLVPSYTKCRPAIELSPLLQKFFVRCHPHGVADEVLVAQASSGHESRIQHFLKAMFSGLCLRSPFLGGRDRRMPCLFACWGTLVLVKDLSLKWKSLEDSSVHEALKTQVWVLKTGSTTQVECRMAVTASQ